MSPILGALPFISLEATAPTYRRTNVPNLGRSLINGLNLDRNKVIDVRVLRVGVLFMRVPVDLRSHPLKFLLRLEWIILGLLALLELPALPVLPLPRLPTISIVGLIVFSLLGLRLPKQLTHKLLYLGLEISLVLVLSWVSGVRLFQVLFLVIVMRNCILFEGISNTIVTSGVFLLYATTQLHRLMLTLPKAGIVWGRVGLIWVSLMLLFGLIIVFLQMLVYAILQERRGREQLAIANAQLRTYALKIEDQATLQERNRIAREIHDSLGHSLTVFNLHVEAALRLWEAEPREAKALLTEAKQISAQALQEVRQSVSTLRTDVFQGRSLAAAIASLIEDFQRSTQIVPHQQIQHCDHLPEALQVAAYRIIQEALTNIAKYSQATDVEIAIETNLTNQNALEICIKDNGIGFDINQTKTGFGLQGIQERTQNLSGTLQILTAPRQGCKIIAQFPIYSHPPNL
jgi:signal transduction histidine kinase